MAEEQVNGNGNGRDPRLLLGEATAQTLHEIDTLKELVFARLDAMDKAMALFESNASRVPTDTDKAIGHLGGLVDSKIKGLADLTNEKFLGVEKQFSERDSRIEQTARDSKLAIDAALQAAEKAVGKSELSTLKQIDGQADLIRTNTKGIDDRVADLKERVTRIESIAVGRVAEVGEVRSAGADTRGILALVISGVMALAGLVSFVMALNR